MKKLSFLFFLLAAPGLIMFTGVNASAQSAEEALAAGNIIIDGSIDLTATNRTKTETSKSERLNSDDPDYTSYTQKDEQTSYSGNIAAGIFIMPGLAIGVMGSYERDVEKRSVAGTRTQNSKNTSFEVGPEVRYFIGGMGIVMPYVTLSAVYVKDKYIKKEYSDGWDTNDSGDTILTIDLKSAADRQAYEASGFGWGLGIGCSVLITESVALFAEFNYMMYDTDRKYDNHLEWADHWGNTDKEFEEQGQPEDIEYTKMKVYVGLQAFISMGMM